MENIFVRMSKILEILSKNLYKTVLFLEL